MYDISNFYASKINPRNNSDDATKVIRLQSFKYKWALQRWEFIKENKKVRKKEKKKKERK